MAWNNAIVTNNGIALLQQVLTGGVLNIDGVSGGTGTVDPGVLKAQTALTDQRQTLTIVGTYNVTGGKKLNIQIVSVGLATGYTLQQVGIWAHVDSGSTVLFAIIQDSTGFAIPSETELAAFAVNILPVVNFSNENSFTYTIDPVALVTLGTLNASLPLPLKNLTLPTTGWTAYTGGALREANYQYDLSNAEISADFYVDGYIHDDSLDETAACGLSEQITTYDGGAIFYVTNVPSQPIHFDLLVTIPRG